MKKSRIALAVVCAVILIAVGIGIGVFAGRRAGNHGPDLPELPADMEETMTREDTEESDTTGPLQTEEETEAAADGLTEDFDPGYTDRDLDGTYAEEEAVWITLSDNGIIVDGEGAAANGSVLTIKKAGIYVLQGSLSDGQILVALGGTGKDDKVQLVLNGVSINCSDGPAIWIQEADKAFVTLASGSENTLKDGGSYADESDDAPNAVLYSACDLTINGEGSLTVTGKNANGIATRDDLVVTGGILTVSAAGHGLKGKDSVAICGGVITVEAGNDAIKSDQDNSTEKGWISIDGGTLILTSSDMGLEAQNDIYVTDGKLTIHSENDCFHSNDSLRISGGTMTLTSSSKGIHADDYLTLDGGDIEITTCTEGLEGLVITINGGSLSINATDDGINATDGTGRDEGGTMSRGFLQGLFGNNSSENTIRLEINGGVIYIQARGDGVDSNGSLTVNGGELYVDGPTSSADGALDYASSGTITGGTVVAVGSAGMAVNFSEAQGQCSWMVSASSAQAAGSTITLTDANGTVLLSYTPQKTYQSIVISTPDMVQGGTYTLSVDGTELATATLSDLITGSGSGMGGGMNGGFGGGRSQGGRSSGRTQETTPAETTPPETMPADNSVPTPSGRGQTGIENGGEIPDMGEMPGGMTFPGA